MRKCASEVAITKVIALRALGNTVAATIAAARPSHALTGAIAFARSAVLARITDAILVAAT